MERTLADDLKAGLFVFAGVFLGYLVFAPDTSVLLGALIGLVIATVALNVVRLIRRRRHP
jgi:hypothetical protein